MTTFGGVKHKSFRCPSCGYAQPKVKLGEERKCSICGSRFMVLQGPEVESIEEYAMKQTMRLRENVAVDKNKLSKLDR